MARHAGIQCRGGFPTKAISGLQVSDCFRFGPSCGPTVPRERQRRRFQGKEWIRFVAEPVPFSFGQRWVTLTLPLAAEPEKQDGQGGRSVTDLGRWLHVGQSRAVPSREIAHRRLHPECECITAGNGGIDQVHLGMRVEGRAFERCLEWDGSALGSQS